MLKLKFREQLTYATMKKTNRKFRTNARRALVTFAAYKNGPSTARPETADNKLRHNLLQKPALTYVIHSCILYKYCDMRAETGIVELGETVVARQWHG
jgi:hypothetical protein